MDSAVPLTRWPRHDGDPSIEQVFTCHIKIRVASTKHAREKRLQTGINFIEGFFKTRTSLLIDFLDGILKGSQCTFEIFILFIQINLSLGLLCVFVYCCEIDWTQALDTGGEAL